MECSGGNNDHVGVHLAASLMEYRKNPHHINPMSERFQMLLTEVINHLVEQSTVRLSEDGKTV